MNPQGAVPLLVDGDLVLSQNVAILAYLDARFPEARLFGSDTIEGKARAWRWLAFLNADVQGLRPALPHSPLGRRGVRQERHATGRPHPDCRHAETGR